MKIIIIDNYDSFTYNLYQMLQPLCNEDVLVYRNDKITFLELVAEEARGIVLSPGPGHPSKTVDFGVCDQIIRRRAELYCPVLGVCLGHQGIVHHLGGKVVNAPEIVHGKTSQIKRTQDSAILEGLPQCFDAMRYHSLIAADDQSFPQELEVTARESTGGLIMAIQHKTDPLYGVQFHPESIGTPLGHRILENFVKLCS